MNIEEIKKLLPHRHPFLLIDKVEDIVLGESCTAYKNIAYDSWYFKGHFPNYPIMPGVLIIEAMAQAAGVLAISTLKNETLKSEALESEILKSEPLKSVFFASITEAKFKKQVVPGDVLKIEVKVIQRRTKIWKFQANAFVDGELSDFAEFTAVVP